MTYGAVTNDKAFTDWTADDLIALSYYDGAGPNNSGSDVYHAYDGYDSSRDLVAFYAHDGGAASAGGDGNFYFRVDLNDLAGLRRAGISSTSTWRSTSASRAVASGCCRTTSTP